MKITATYYRCFLGLIALLFFSAANAQKQMDTLSEVQIKEKKKQTISQDLRLQNFSSGQKIITIDTALLQQYKMQSTAQLLSQHVPVFIKSYGFNGLATLNFRGSSSAQSQVYWNGVPIQNAALGMADISLLPVQFMNNIQVVYGGSSALLGSGNVGGALWLETDKPQFHTTPAMNYELGLGAGSFAQYQFAGKWNYATKKWFVAANLIAQTAKNDFKYFKNGKEIRNENSKLKGASALLQAAYQPNIHHTFRLMAWVQQYDRELPAALFESYSVKKRKDVSVRLLADWKYQKKNSEQYARLSFIQDKMHYEDSATQLFSQNDVNQIYAEAGWKQDIAARHKILVFVPLNFSFMKVDTSWVHQLKTALAAAYSYHDRKEKLIVNLSARAGVINDYTVFLPGLSASYQLNKWMQLRANIQKTFRAPTLNELYFEPGGNKQLQPEKGWATDAGYHIQLQPTQQFSISHDVAVYYRFIHNWILWFGGAIWTPHNLAAVQSSGVEADWDFKYRLNKIVFHLGWKIAYTQAITTQSLVAGDGSVGKQIPYTPKWMGLINAGINYAGYGLNWNYVYTDHRYFNTDETGYLPAYSLTNIQLSKERELKFANLQASLLLNNLFAETYTVVAGRMMPGRNFALSLTLRKK